MAVAKTAALIFLHGLGDTAAGWGVVVPMMRQRAPHVNVVTPTAPVMPVTVNGGMSMTSWFDMADIPVLAETADDEASMEAYGLKVLNGLIDEQVAAGIEPSRIVVGGFSQGGCTALLCSLRRQETLAGVLSISGWLPSYVATEEAIRAGANGTARPPVAWGHGEADPTVTFARAQPNAEALKAAGLDVQFQGYPNVGHDCTSQELDWAMDTVAQWLPPQ